MKSILIVLLTFTAIIQAQSPECKENLSIFAENVKLKNYDSAYEHWRMVYDSCPDINYATYAYANKILRAKINKSSGSEKTASINLLIQVFKDGNKYFPKKVSVADVKMLSSLVMYDYKTGTQDEIYKTLDEGFNKDKAHFDNPKALYLYFSLLVNLHKEHKYGLQEVFDTYDALSETIEANTENMAKRLEVINKKEADGTITGRERKVKSALIKKSAIYGKISNSIENKLGALADCKNLIPLYSKNFEAHKDDIVWLQRAAARMDDKNCTDSPLFIKLSEQLHRLNPSSQSAYYVALLKDKKGNSHEAIKLYNEAVSLEKDSYRKAKILLKISSKYKRVKREKQAYAYAKKALAVRPSYGAAYMMIASIYADSANECGKNQFEKRSIYWKAEEMAKKAGKVDPSLSKKSAQAANSYGKRAPQKSDIFQSGLAGQTIKFDCWIGGSVKVPTL